MATITNSSMTTARNLEAVLTAALLAAAMTLYDGSAHASQGETPDALINRFAAELITVSTDDTVRTAEFRCFLTSKFGCDLVSRFLMVGNLCPGSAAQRTYCPARFDDLIGATYARWLSSYDVETLAIPGVGTADCQDNPVETVLSRRHRVSVSLAWQPRA